MAHAIASNLDDDDALNKTLSFSPDVNDPLFHICWRRQSCGSCLTGDAPCSWCPFSSTCVPNPSRLPILTPLRSVNTCPLGSKERWEIRTQPFGCNVSTLTFLSVLVAVAGTLAAVGLGFVLVWLGRKITAWWREKKGKGVSVFEWMKVKIWRGWGIVRGRRRRAVDEYQGDDNDDDDDDIRENRERRPLLG